MVIPAGTRLGRYEILFKIGEGGMGEVYLAEDTQLLRQVALKILPADIASHKDRMRRFVQEAQSAAALNHPNIATIHEIGENDGLNFIAMEFIDYPRDPNGPGNLGVIYGQVGQHGNLALYLISLNRFAEAKDVCTRALGQKLDSFSIRDRLYSLAFVGNDSAAMQEQLAWASGKPNEYRAVDWESETAAFGGAWRRSQDLARRATEMAVRSDAKEVGAQYTAEAASLAAALGQNAQSVGLAEAALKLTRTKVTLTYAALALALAGDAAKTQPLMTEIEQQYPKDTIVNQLNLPMVKAALELRKGNAQAAIELLEAAKRYEPAADFWPQYLRGLAYLKIGKGAEAAAEYQKILDHRGQSPLSMLYPLAHLGLARGVALLGDPAKARQEYQEFFTMWRDADSNLPILVEAKKDFEKLR